MGQVCFCVKKEEAKEDLNYFNSRASKSPNVVHYENVKGDLEQLPREAEALKMSGDGDDVESPFGSNDSSINNFIILKVIGKGSMGKVYLVEKRDSSKRKIRGEAFLIFKFNKKCFTRI